MKIRASLDSDGDIVMQTVNTQRGHKQPSVKVKIGKFDLSTPEGLLLLKSAIEAEIIKVKTGE